MKKLETCPQLALLRYDEDGQLQCGIYIFIEEAIKLTRHLNATFSFSTSECLLFTSTASKPIEKYTDDNFF